MVFGSSEIVAFYNTCGFRPLIATQPAPLTFVDAGSHVTLSIEDQLGTPPISYQWRRQGEALTDGNGVSGATTPDLMLAGLIGVDTNEYDCVVTNDIGTDTSNVAIVAVRQTCYPDCNGDGVLNILDFVCFQQLFIKGCGS